MGSVVEYVGCFNPFRGWSSGFDDFRRSWVQSGGVKVFKCKVIHFVQS